MRNAPALLAAALAVAILSPASASAQAAPQPAAPVCQVSADKVLSDLADAKAEIVGVVPYKGQNADLLIIYAINGTLAMVALKGDCYQAGPINLDAMSKEIGV